MKLAALQTAALLAALLAPAARAQSGEELAPEAYRATHYTVDDGLPQGSINALLQTADGALWAATFGGLVRFDGLEFKVTDLETLPGMPSNRVTALADDLAGGLWLALQSGHVLHYSEGKQLACERIPGVDMQPLSLLLHPNGSLWVECESGAIARFADGHWSELVASGGHGGYSGLCLDQEQRVWAALDRDLYGFEPDGSLHEHLSTRTRMLGLARGNDGRPWVGMANGLARLTEEGVMTVPLSLGEDTAVQCILPGPSGDLWLGTTYGPVHVVPPGEPAREVQLDSNMQVPDCSVRAMLRDREGNLWFGSDGFGLLRLRPHPLESFGPAEWRTGVSAFAEDGAGGVYVGMGCNGLFRIRAGRWNPEPVALPASAAGTGCIEALLRDADGRVWVGKSGAVLRQDARVSQAFEPALGGRRFEGGLGPFAQGAEGSVWVSSRRGHLLQLGRDERVLRELELPSGIQSLAPAPDGSLWIGGEGELTQLVEGRIESFGASAGVPRGVLRDLHFDADGGLWIASYGGGLGYWKDRRGVCMTRAHGLPDNSLTALREDPDGRLWILSNLGLVVAARAEILSVFSGAARQFAPVVLGQDAGMPESEYGEPASLGDAQGRFWFGTIAGPVRVDPTKFPFNRTPPKVSVEHLHADDDPIPLQARAPLPPLTRRVVIEYTAFALTAPERARFRYRLLGFDEDWTEAGTQRWAAFTGLAPGRYAFEVLARNEDGIWSDTPARVEFEQLPAWWQTWSFRAGALFAVCALLFYLHRRRIEIVRARGQVLVEATEGRARAEERESRLRDELAHAGRLATAGELASSLAHEVNQPLAAIVTNAQAGQRFLAREPFSRAELEEVLSDIAHQGQRASEVIRRLREFLSKHEAQRQPVDLNEIVRGTLPLVRREIQDQGVHTRLELEPELPKVDADPVQLQQVLVNLVKNSCEALAGRPGQRLIEIRSRRYDGRVQLEVSDNGPASHRRSRTGFSSPTSRPRRTAWGSDSRSAARSSRPTAAGSPPTRARAAACASTSTCPRARERPRERAGSRLPRRRRRRAAQGDDAPAHLARLRGARLRQRGAVPRTLRPLAAGLPAARPAPAGPERPRAAAHAGRARRHAADRVRHRPRGRADQRLRDEAGRRRLPREAGARGAARRGAAARARVRPAHARGTAARARGAEALCDAHRARARGLRGDHRGPAQQAGGADARDRGAHRQAAPLARARKDGRGVRRRPRAHGGVARSAARRPLRAPAGGALPERDMAEFGCVPQDLAISRAMPSFPQPPDAATVFVVDDDPLVGRALERLLRSAGCAVETFASAHEFLAREPLPARGILLLDVQMPGMSGPQLHEHLRAKGSVLQVLFMSGLDAPRVRDEVLAAGARAWFQKPIEGEDLLRAVGAR